MTKRKTTIKVVAQAAGVSTASVSRALSGRRPVTPAVRDAVLKAARELDYRPHHTAQSLRYQSTRTIGMAVSTIANPFFPHLISAVEVALRASDRALLLSDSQNSTEVEQALILSLLSGQVDALIIAPNEGSSLDSLEYARALVPIVQVDRFIPGLAADHVGVDDRLGIQLLLEHLEQQGCRRLIYVGPNRGTMSTASSRLDAYQDLSSVLDPDNPNAYMLGDFSLQWGLAAGLEIGEAASLPDAVVCANDLIAIGVIRGLRTRNIRIPQDILITGFDGIDLSQFANPSLTTARQPFAEIGQIAVSLLISRIDGDSSPPRRIFLKPELIASESTGAEAATISASPITVQIGCSDGGEESSGGLGP